MHSISGGDSSGGGGGGGGGGVSWGQKVFSAFAFGIVSFVIVFTNKFVLGDHNKCTKCYGFPSVKFLAFAQCAASCLVMLFQKLVLGHALGDERYKNLFPPLSWHVVRQISPLPLLFFLNMVSGLSATKSLNIPMFVLLRRFSIAMTLALEFAVLKKSSTRVIVASVGIMLVGALIAAADDVTVDMYSAFLHSDERRAHCVAGRDAETQDESSNSK